jgi:c-di-GMP-binding flagellar brake protein YcgR
MFRERRKTARRETDRAQIKRIQDLEKLLEKHGGGMQERARKERRRAIRHQCKVKIEMAIRYSSNRSDDWAVDTIEIKGRLLDLSSEGVSLFTREQFDTGQKLHITIILPDSKKIVAAGDVRWVKAMPEKGAFASGVKYQEVDEKSQKNLQRFLSYLDSFN